MRNLVVITVCLAALSVFSSFTKTPSYIRLQHIGLNNKPFPTLIFYVDNYVDTTFGQAFKYSYKVSRTEIGNLFKVISDYQPQTGEESPYSIYSFLGESDGIRKEFRITKTRDMAVLYRQMLAQLKDTTTIKQVKEMMNGTLYRLLADEWPIE